MDRRDRVTAKFFDENYNLLGIEDEAVVMYTSRWHTYGQFSIQIDAMQSYVKEGNRIIFDDEGKKNGIIKYINVADDGTVTIKGYSLLWLLTQRITVPPQGKAYSVYNAPVEDIMCDLVRLNATDKADIKRRFPHLSVQASKGRGQKLKYQTRYDGLLDDLTELSKYSMLGISIRVDYVEGKEIFEVDYGVDRSLSQDVNQHVVFRKSYDNINTEVYTLDTTVLKNCAYTAGQGEGADRTIVIVGDSSTGEDRNELFIDARDINDKSDLAARGDTKLAEYAIEENFEVTVDPQEYKQRWYMGDKVTVVGEDSGVTLNAYITEIQENYDASGYEIVPTLGNPTKIIGQDSTTSGGAGGGSGTGETSSSGGGVGLQFKWDNTSLGVKRENESVYQYTDLKGVQGEQGEQGIPGTAATISIGSVTTGTAGGSATVTNVGTETNAILDFKIPRGSTGAKGEKGDTGEMGPQGEKGDKGDKGDPGTISDEAMASIATSVLELLNPVGTIRMSTDSANPATYLGFGTWVAWGEGRVPVGVDSTQTEFATTEKTGGAKTHTLTVAEMPSHTHDVTTTFAYGSNDPKKGVGYAKTVAGKFKDGLISLATAGSGNAHNNLQPYVTCYMWKRTA